MATQPHNSYAYYNNPSSLNYCNFYSSKGFQQKDSIKFPNSLGRYLSTATFRSDDSTPVNIKESKAKIAGDSIAVPVLEKSGKHYRDVLVPFEYAAAVKLQVKCPTSLDPVQQVQKKLEDFTSGYEQPLKSVLDSDRCFESTESVIELIRNSCIELIETEHLKDFLRNQPYNFEEQQSLIRLILSGSQPTEDQQDSIKETNKANKLRSDTVQNNSETLSSATHNENDPILEKETETKPTWFSKSLGYATKMGIGAAAILAVKFALSKLA